MSTHRSLFWTTITLDKCIHNLQSGLIQMFNLQIFSCALFFSYLCLCPSEISLSAPVCVAVCWIQESVSLVSWRDAGSCFHFVCGLRLPTSERLKGVRAMSGNGNSITSDRIPALISLTSNNLYDSPASPHSNVQLIHSWKSFHVVLCGRQDPERQEDSLHPIS